MRAIATLINRSKNSYIILSLRVALHPTGIPFRIEKFEIDLLDFVITGFCPVIVVKTWVASSTILASSLDFPSPILMTIFSIFGTAILFLYLYFFIIAGIISC